MFNFTELFQYLQNGQLEMALGILQVLFYDDKSIDLSSEDKEQLLSILVFLHELIIGLPENTGEFQHQQVLQAHPVHAFVFDDFILNGQAAPPAHLVPERSAIYSVSSQIIFFIKMLLEPPAARVYAIAGVESESTDSIIIEFLLNEENHARGFLRNVIFQEHIANYARDSRTPFFHRLMTDASFTHYICQDINPNMFLGENNEDILTCASRYGASPEVYEALVFHGADVNGRVTPSIFFENQLTRQVNSHFVDPMESSRTFFSLRSQAPEAKVFFQNGPKTPLIEAILSGKFEYVKCLLASPQIVLTRNEHLPLDGCRSMSPLMLAAYLGRLNMVQALLVRGANINEVDNVGESAIFYALRANRLPVFYFLLEQPGIHLSLINQQGQALQDLMHSFNYPAMAEIFSPIERLVLLIAKKPGFLSQYIFDLLETRLSIMVTKLKKDEVVPFLIKNQEESALSHPLFFPKKRPNCFMGKFLMMSENHLQLPSIYADSESEKFVFRITNQRNYVVMKAANDATYQVLCSPFSLEKTYHIAIFAYQIKHLQHLPFDCLMKVFSYLTSEEIINLFETPEEAAQILNDPQLDTPGIGYGGGFRI